MARIDNNLFGYIKGKFKDRKVGGSSFYYTHQTTRFIYVTTWLAEDTEIHYEFYQNKVELHLEGKYQSEEYRNFVKELRVRTSRNPVLKWLSWQGHSQCRCQIDAPTDSQEDVMKAFEAIMIVFDSIIEDVHNSLIPNKEIEPYNGVKGFTETGLNDDEVSLETCSLGQIFSNTLVIPDYQRNYCWERKQLSDLWQSLKDVTESTKYHLGTIILQKDANGQYAVIDGQQRLVTLTIILNSLGYKGDLPLLNQSFHSNSSRQHIANNKWHIDQLCQRLHDAASFGCRLVNNLIFSVLILKENRLDLAYTFFSNQNAKGVVLSDFDLLKAHHLRFISSEKQQEHLVGNWNNLIEKKHSSLDMTLSTHIYRLRKWMRRKSYDVNEPHRVKEEYSSAPVIKEIPPFGEKFHFYEKIQGGSHFFAYTQHFVDLYSTFEQTPQVKTLRNNLKWESHWKYESVIESLLFGYFLKFGNSYLTEALMCISEAIAQHRYTSKALYYKILEYAKESEIIMMIDQASSPTFFLAECQSSISIYGRDLNEVDIKMRFYQKLENMRDELYMMQEEI